jgi:Peptidase family S41/N-terminal domain of Peptidase_S41 in eukaryotic IRBP
MLIRILLIVLAGLAAGLPQGVNIPDTPAGHTLKTWLDAFNSGDRATEEQYLKTYDPGRSLDEEMRFRGMTGGFSLTQILKSGPQRIEFMVREHNSGTVAIGKMEVNPGEPAKVASFSLHAVPPGTKGANLSFNIDAATRAKVIDGVIAALNDTYVFPETAKQMEKAIRAHQQKGDYDAISDGDDFAKRLTDDLQAVSHDKHLRVMFSPAALPDLDNQKPDPKREAEERKQMERLNCGFQKAEILEGNIGYLKFDFFADPNICGPTAVAAMNFLANVDAIIFDLRENHGGDPQEVAFISSYLFAERTHLNDLWTRKGDVTEQYWTDPYVPGKRLDGKPAFVLTSKNTFSGGEEFTNNLKVLNRATIVGETTGGGAHPVRGHRVTEHFAIGVPFARAINPVTHTNWEETGVEPDVKVDASQALEVAIKLATERVKNNANQPERLP